MPRETIDSKARRYLAEGRLRVTGIDPHRVNATCNGERTYTLGRTNRSWWCDCPARVQCAHITALQLVTVDPLRHPDRQAT
jgi:uncharacterized Zn finger protein